MNLGIVALIAAAGLAGVAEAQTNVRVRGTITAFDGQVLSVKSREGQNLQLRLAEKTTVSYMKALKISDIKVGDGVGTAALPGSDGSLVALEIHKFAPERGVPNQGHRKWDLEPGSTMTNGRVSTVVQSARGRELTLTYKDGSKKVVVPENAPIVTAMRGDRSLLKTGEYVLVAARKDESGALTALRIQVSKDGVKPPQ